MGKEGYFAHSAIRADPLKDAALEDLCTRVRVEGTENISGNAFHPSYIMLYFYLFADTGL